MFLSILYYWKKQKIKTTKLGGNQPNCLLISQPASLLNNFLFFLLVLKKMLIWAQTPNNQSETIIKRKGTVFVPPIWAFSSQTAPRYRGHNSLLVHIALSKEWGLVALTAIERHSDLWYAVWLFHRPKWMSGSLISIRRGDGTSIQAVLGAHLLRWCIISSNLILQALVFVSTSDKIL